MTDEYNVANPGSTLGEAVGALVEQELNRLLRPISEDNGCVFVSAGRPNPKTGHATKLLLRDAAGNEFHIDAVIANNRLQPLVIIESKYIRYKKHNRDKGSWICTAHYSLRRFYPTIRKSIAVLAGSWSGSSKALLESFDVTLFEVKFQHIVEVLAQYGIKFDWGEKDRHLAMQAWQSWQKLTDNDYQIMASKLLAAIEPDLRAALSTSLNTATPREVARIEITVETNLGETHTYKLESMEQAINLLRDFDAEQILNSTEGPSLWTIDNNT